MYNRWHCILAWSLAGVLAACAAPTTAAPPGRTEPAPSLPPPRVATATLIPTPSATPEPLAARVNGQGIPLARYQAEVARCQQARAQAQVSAEACPTEALDLLIDQALIEHAALASGLTVSAAALAQAEADLGPDLLTWWADQGYTPDTGRAALARELLRAAWIDQWTRAQVGETAAQIRLRVLVLANEADAQAALARLAAGADFAALAREVSLDAGSRLAGGDLGWLVRGTLTQPALEEAAWNLTSGQTSLPLPSDIGWVVINVMERDSARALTPAQRDTLRQRALAAWLSAQRAQATLERLSP